MRGIDVSEPQSLINLNYTLSLDDAWHGSWFMAEVHETVIHEP